MDKVAVGQCCVFETCTKGDTRDGLQICGLILWSMAAVGYGC